MSARSVEIARTLAALIADMKALAARLCDPLQECPQPTPELPPDGIWRRARWAASAEIKEVLSRHAAQPACNVCGGSIRLVGYSQWAGTHTEVLDSWWAHDDHPANGHDAVADLRDQQARPCRCRVVPCTCALTQAERADLCTCGMAEQERTGHCPEHAEWCDAWFSWDDDEPRTRPSKGDAQ